jgi:preprotein translocase subunit YajC
MPDKLAWNAVVLLAQDAANPPPGGGLLAGPWLPLIVVGLLFYFMLLRPERRRRNEHAAMLSNLKKNDRVITAGGIYGTVVNVNQGGSDVTLKVDENSNTRLRVLRTSISRVLTAEEEREAVSEDHKTRTDVSSSPP